VVLFLMTRTQDRDPLFHWIGPVQESVFAFYARAGAPIKIASWDDAKAVRSIGVYIDDVRDQILTKAGFTNLVRSFNLSVCYKNLATGRLDLVADSTTGFPANARAAGSSPDDFKQVFILGRVQHYIAMSKGTAPAVAAAWSAALAEMRRDGTMLRLLRRYLPEAVLPGPVFIEF
jgi:polar amino acid transport system substrate-binding protein